MSKDKLLELHIKAIPLSLVDTHWKTVFANSKTLHIIAETLVEHMIHNKINLSTTWYCYGNGRKIYGDGTLE